MPIVLASWGKITWRVLSPPTSQIPLRTPRVLPPWPPCPPCPPSLLILGKLLERLGCNFRLLHITSSFFHHNTSFSNRNVSYTSYNIEYNGFLYSHNTRLRLNMFLPRSPQRPTRCAIK